MKIAIISWTGQHEKAKSIYDQLCPLVHNCEIVVSEDGSDQFKKDYRCNIRPNTSFWGDKFFASISGDATENVLIIHADCQCTNWPSLLEKCKEAFDQHSEIAIWAPMIIGTPFPVSRTEIEKIPNTTLRKVAQTDGLIVALRRDIVFRMRDLDYSSNVFGWGIDWVFLSSAYSRQACAAVDTSVFVKHTIGTGYKRLEASDQMRDFLDQMNPEEKTAYTFLVKHIKSQS